MERTELKTKLEEFVYAEEISVDLFFIFRNNDINIQYKTEPNQGLRDVLIKDFLDELERYIDDENPYELVNIYDDNEHGEYKLYYDRIDNNAIAQSTFVFEHENVQPYSNEVGELSKIHAFLIEFYNGTEFLSIYKRNMPTNSINPSKLINFMVGAGNRFELINKASIYFNKKIDIFRIGDNIIINSRSTYEGHFGFVAELKRKAENSYLSLVATNAFDLSDSLQEKVKKLTHTEMKKLNNCVVDNPILENRKYDVIIRQAKRYGKHEFNKNDAGQIIIKSKKDLQLLILILNRDFNINEATKEKFITKNKTPIKN